MQCAAERVAPEAAATHTPVSVIQRPPARQCDELERLPRAVNSHNRVPTTGVTAGGGRGGLGATAGSALIDLSASVITGGPENELIK